jgi:DNA-binding transcriptional ArsR family regulator
MTTAAEIETLSAESLMQLRASASRACSLLKTMANEDRLMLLCHLIDTELNVGELEALTEIRQPTLSQQLGVLRDEKLVSTRREGKYIFYRLANPAVLSMMRTLHRLYCEPTKT